MYTIQHLHIMLYAHVNLSPMHTVYIYMVVNLYLNLETKFFIHHSDAYSYPQKFKGGL